MGKGRGGGSNELLYVPSFDEAIEELPAFGHFHHNIPVLVVLKQVSEPDYIPVLARQAKNLHFGHDLFVFVVVGER